MRKEGDPELNPAERTRYNFKPKLSDDIITSQNNLVNAEKDLGEVFGASWAPTAVTPAKPVDSVAPAAPVTPAAPVEPAAPAEAAPAEPAAPAETVAPKKVNLGAPPAAPVVA